MLYNNEKFGSVIKALVDTIYSETNFPYQLLPPPPPSNQFLLDNNGDFLLDNTDEPLIIVG